MINLKNLWISMRPKQWIKNLFVFAAIIFIRQFTNLAKLEVIIFAFVLFSLASSAIYIINDIADFEEDEKHPRKKNRPIAAERLKKSTALVFAIILGLISAFAGFYINNLFGILIVSFIILSLLYSFYLKKLIIIDVITIALGFVIRVIAGAVAINVVFSQWLILSTFFLTLFLATSKRKNEIRFVMNGERRSGLERYPAEQMTTLFDQMNTIVLPSTIITYAFYTFSSEHSKLLMVTIPIVLYGLFRYLFLANIKQYNDDGPTDDLLLDGNILITIFIWLIVSVAIILYAK